jgi:hypothetical protein
LRLWFGEYRINDAFGQAGAWRAACDLFMRLASHSEQEVSGAIGALYKLEDLARMWRPAVGLIAPLVRDLMERGRPDIRLGAMYALRRLIGYDADKAVRHMAQHDPLLTLRLEAEWELKTSPAHWVPEFRQQPDPLPGTVDDLIAALTALADAPLHSGERTKLRALLFTLRTHGAAARAALPVVRRLVTHGDYFEEAVRLWWTLAPEEGEAITVAVMGRSRGLPTVAMIELLGEISAQASGAVDLLTRFVQSELRGGELISYGMNIADDERLRAAAVRALARIQGDMDSS